MPKPTGKPPTDIMAQVGEENLEALADLTKQVVERVGPTVLRWKVAWGIEEMIAVVVLHTCIVSSREMRLGELAAELLTSRAAEVGDWEWAVRTRSPRGDRIAVMRDEAAARDYADPPVSGEHSYAAMRRRIGRWEEASVAKEDETAT